MSPSNRIESYLRWLEFGASTATLRVRNDCHRCIDLGRLVTRGRNLKQIRPLDHWLTRPPTSGRSVFGLALHAPRRGTRESDSNITYCSSIRRRHDEENDRHVGRWASDGTSFASTATRNRNSRDSECQENTKPEVTFHADTPIRSVPLGKEGSKRCT